MPRAALSILHSGLLALSGPPLQEVDEAGRDDDAEAQERQDREEKPVDVAPVVVTPTRGGESLLEIPAALSVVDARELARTLPQNTPDALAAEPGVVMQKSHQGGGSPVVRGRTGKDVLLLIDGQRFSNTTFRRNHQYLSTVDSFALGSVEIVRGPASVLYGSDAMGGAVNLLLRRREVEGLDDWGGRLFTQYETANRAWISHAGAEGETDGLGWLAGITTRDFDDLRAGRVGEDPIHAVDVNGRQVPTGYRERAFNLALSKPLTDHDTIDFAMLYGRQWNVPTSDRLIPNEKDPAPSDLVRKVDPQRLRWYELRLRHEDEGATLESLQAIASLNAPEETRHRVRSSTPTLLELEQDSLTAPGISLQGGIRWREENLLTIGAEAYFERVDSEARTLDTTDGSWTVEPTGRYPDGARYDTFGVFAQDEWKLGGGFEWINGLRYSRIEVALDFDGLMVGSAGPFGRFDEVYDDVTFATGLSRRLDEETTVWGSLARGFRAPNLDDLAVVGDFAAGERVPSFDVDPEKVWNLEVGATHLGEPTRAGIAGAVAFYRDLLTNRFAFTQGGQDFFVVDNAGRATIYSIETWLDRQLCESDAGARHSLFFQAFASFGRNETDGEPVSKVPPPEAMLGHRMEGGASSKPGDAAARWIDAPWFLELFARGALAQQRLAAVDELDPRIPIDGTPPWWTLNLRSGANVARGVWIYAGLENLFNYRYRTHGSGIDASGRSFTVGVDWRF
jgi:outer membrane receptor protein involved in Fe transport